MKPKFKTTFLISGIALGCMAIGISAGVIAELASIGEDVGEAEGIIEERRTTIQNDMNKIQELLQRLGIQA